jgi:hypothetical protein
MKSIDIHVSTARHPLWISASTIQRGAWLSFVMYSAKNDMDGIIVGAWLWTDQQWFDATGGLISDLDDIDNIEANSPLWKWVGDDLHIELYPRGRRPL